MLINLPRTPSVNTDLTPHYESLKHRWKHVQYCRLIHTRTVFCFDFFLKKVPVAAMPYGLRSVLKTPAVVPVPDGPKSVPTTAPATLDRLANRHSSPGPSRDHGLLDPQLSPRALPGLCLVLSLCRRLLGPHLGPCLCLSQFAPRSRPAALCGPSHGPP